MTPAPSFRVLGPLQVVTDGTSLNLGGPKQRSILALLLVDHGRVVSFDRMIDTLWGDEAGDGVRNLIQVHVSNLRRSLEPAVAALGVSALVQTRAPGYVVDLPPESLDLAQFELRTTDARQLARRGELEASAAELATALSLWQGPPLADLTGEPGLGPIITRLEGARLTAESDHVEVLLANGNHREVLEQAADLVHVNPYDERLRGLLMLALYRSGRQVDALTVFKEGRHLLVEELGIEPSAELRELEGKILRQDPDLDLPVRSAPDQQVSTILASSVLAPRAKLLTPGGEVALDRSITTIGRRNDQTIVLDDLRVSRQHAEIRRTPSGFVLADRGSTNGVSVNGARIDGAVDLRPGDEIVIGSTTLQFVDS